MIAGKNIQPFALCRAVILSYSQTVSTVSTVSTASTVVGVDAHSARPNDYSHAKEHLRTVFGLTQVIWSVSSSFNLIMMINRMNKGQAQNICFCCVSSV